MAVNNMIAEIPEVYKWHNNMRFISPYGSALADLTLDQLSCPSCGKYKLVYKPYNLYGIVSGTHVVCPLCSWLCPIDFDGSPDEVQALDRFKLWLEGWKLTGASKNTTKINFINLFDTDDDDEDDSTED